MGIIPNSGMSQIIGLKKTFLLFILVQKIKSGMDALKNL